MATQLLATGTTAADSTELTVASGAPATVSLKGVVDGTAAVRIALKDDEGNFHVIGELTSGSPSKVISSPGVYRFSRVAGGACGVFSG